MVVSLARAARRFRPRTAVINKIIVIIDLHKTARELISQTAREFMFIWYSKIILKKNVSSFIRSKFHRHKNSLKHAIFKGIYQVMIIIFSLSKYICTNVLQQHTRNYWQHAVG